MHLGRFLLYFLSLFCFFWIWTCQRKQNSVDHSIKLSTKISIESLYFDRIPETHYKIQTHLSPLPEQDQPIVVEFKSYQVLPEAQQIRFKTLAGTYYKTSTCLEIEIEEDKESVKCEALFENRKNGGAESHHQQKVPLYFFRFLDTSGREAKIVNLKLDVPDNYVFLNYLQNDGSVNYLDITPINATNFEPLKIGLINNQVKVDPIYSPLAQEISRFCRDQEDYRLRDYKVRSGDQKTEHTYRIQFFYYPRILAVRSLVNTLNLSYTSNVFNTIAPEEHVEIQSNYFPQETELEITANKDFTLIRDEKTRTFIVEFKHYTGETIKYYLDFRSFLQITSIQLDGKTQNDWNQKVKNWHSGKNGQLTLKNEALYPEKIILQTNPATWDVENIETLALSVTGNPNELDVILTDVMEDGQFIAKHLLSPVRRITLKNIDGESRDYYLYIETEDVKLTGFNVENPSLLPIFSEPNVQKWEPGQAVFIETLRMPTLKELSYSLKGFNYTHQVTLDEKNRRFELNITQRNTKRFDYFIDFKTLEIDEVTPNSTYLTQTNEQIGVFYTQYDEAGHWINPFNPLEPKITEEQMYFHTFLRPESNLFATIKLNDAYAKVEQTWNPQNKQEYLLKVSSQNNPNRSVTYRVPVDFFEPENLLRVNEKSDSRDYYFQLRGLVYRDQASLNTSGAYDYTHVQLNSDVIPKNLEIKYRTFFDRLTGDWTSHEEIQSFFNVKIAYDNQARFSKVDRIIVEHKNGELEHQLKFWITSTWEKEIEIARIQLKQNTQPEFIVKTVSYSGEINRIGGGDIYLQKYNLLQITQENTKNDFNWGFSFRSLTLTCTLIENFELLRTTDLRRDYTLDFFPISKLSSTITELPLEIQNFVLSNDRIIMPCSFTWKDGNTTYTKHQTTVIQKEFTAIKAPQDFFAMDYVVRYGQSRNLDFEQKKDLDFKNLQIPSWMEHPLPLGKKTHPFRWSYNGNNYKISNLVIPKPAATAEQNYGVFGHVAVKKKGIVFENHDVIFKNMQFIDLQLSAASPNSKTGFLIGNVEFVDASLSLHIERCSFKNSNGNELVLAANTNNNFSALGGLIGHTEGQKGYLYVRQSQLTLGNITRSSKKHYAGLVLGYATNPLSIALSGNQIQFSGDKPEEVKNVGGGNFTIFD